MHGLCSFVSRTKNYYTSSCCSGRIMLLEKTGERKKENHFHRKWHRTITREELLEGLAEKIRGELWFKVEPFILHIGCQSLEHANRILVAMKMAGVKRGGIILAEPGKFLVEMQGTQRMSFPVKKADRKLVDEEYLCEALEKANELVSKNYMRLEKLEKELRKELA